LEKFKQLTSHIEQLFPEILNPVTHYEQMVSLAQTEQLLIKLLQLFKQIPFWYINGIRQTVQVKLSVHYAQFVKFKDVLHFTHDALSELRKYICWHLVHLVDN
jgi:hypothetical protein